MKTGLDMMMLEDLTNGDHAICFQTRQISTIFCTKIGNKDIRREFKEMVWACT